MSSTIQVNLESEIQDVSSAKPGHVAIENTSVDQPAVETRNEREQGDNLESRAGGDIREEDNAPAKVQGSCDSSVTTKSTKSSTSSKKKKSLRKRVTSKIGNLLRKASSNDGSKASKLSKDSAGANNLPVQKAQKSGIKDSTTESSGTGLPPRPEKVKEVQVEETKQAQVDKSEEIKVPDDTNDTNLSDPPGEKGSSEGAAPKADVIERESSVPDDANKEEPEGKQQNNASTQTPTEHDPEEEEEEEEEEDPTDIPMMIHAGSMGATTRLTEPDHLQEAPLPLETLASAFTGCLDHSSATGEADAEEVLAKPTVRHSADDIGITACATYYCGVDWTDISQSLGQYVTNVSEEVKVFESPAMALENAVEEKSTAAAASTTDETPQAGIAAPIQRSDSYGNPTNTLVLPPGKSLEENELALREDVVSGCIKTTAVSAREIERVVLFTDIPDPIVEDEEEGDPLAKSISEIAESVAKDAEKVAKDAEKVAKEVERVMFFTDVPEGFAKSPLGESTKDGMALVESKEGSTGLSEDLIGLAEGSVSVINASLATANKEFEELNMRASALFSGNAKDAKDFVELNAQIASEAAEGLLQGLQSNLPLTAEKDKLLEAAAFQS